jgi:catechol 2,3-dioxygenase-like lactoylglutathione lyase family enzyme
MLDHASLGVCDIERSRRFYDAALRPLGIVRIADFGAGRGSDYGAAPSPLTASGVRVATSQDLASSLPRWPASDRNCFGRSCLV